LASERQDRQRVEQLVVAEDSRVGVWPLQRVDKSTSGIGEPTSGEENDRRDSLVMREPRQDNDADPAERQAQ